LGFNHLKKRITVPLAALSLICCSLIVSDANAQPAPFSAISAALQKQMSSAHEASGIKVERVTYAVGGMKLDLRYRVTDIEKAKKVFTNGTALSLIDQATGKMLEVPNMPKIGKLRQIPNQNEAWRVYWIMFDNPGALVRRGGKVTLVIGDIKIKDIIVE